MDKNLQLRRLVQPDLLGFRRQRVRRGCRRRSGTTAPATCTELLLANPAIKPPTPAQIERTAQALPRAAPDPWQFAALPDRRRGRDPAPAGLRERRAEPGSGPDRDEALRRGRPDLDPSPSRSSFSSTRRLEDEDVERARPARAAIQAPQGAAGLRTSSRPSRSSCPASAASASCPHDGGVRRGRGRGDRNVGRSALGGDRLRSGRWCCG